MRLFFCFLLINSWAVANSQLPLEEIALMIKESKVSNNCRLTLLKEEKESLLFGLEKRGERFEFTVQQKNSGQEWFVGRGVEAEGGFWRLIMKNKPLMRSESEIKEWSFKVRDNSLKADIFKLTFTKPNQTETTWDCSL